MGIEETLLRYKKDLEQTQSNLDREKGALSSIYDSLKEELELKGKPNNATIEKKAKERLNELKKESEDLNLELDDLVEEIEEELN